MQQACSRNDAGWCCVGQLRHVAAEKEVGVRRRCARFNRSAVSSPVSEPLRKLARSSVATWQSRVLAWKDGPSLLLERKAAVTAFHHVFLSPQSSPLQHYVLRILALLLHFDQPFLAGATHEPA